MKPASDSGNVGATKVSIYAKIGETAVVVETPVVLDSVLIVLTFLQRNLHEHSLPFSADPDMVVIRSTDIISEFQIMESGNIQNQRRCTGEAQRYCSRRKFGMRYEGHETEHVRRPRLGGSD